MKATFLTILTLMTIALSAQEISSSVVSASGGVFTNENLSMSWSIGEPVTETWENGSFIITQGFQQSNYTITRINKPGKVSFTVDVFPNPVSDYLNISVQDNSENADYILYDLNGQIVSNGKIIGNNTMINMSKLPASTYMLRIHGNNKTADFKIIKNQ